MTLLSGKSLLEVSPRKGGSLLMAAFALAVVGCQPTEEADSPAPTPAPIAFEGETPTDLVGHWETKSKLSMLDLDADGKAVMTNVAPGRGTSTTKGEWRLAKPKLLFRLEGADRVTEYDVEHKGNSLRLKQKATRLDIEYLRKKAK